MFFLIYLIEQWWTPVYLYILKRECTMEKLLLVAMCILLSLIIGVVSGKLVGFGLSKVLERNRYKQS